MTVDHTRDALARRLWPLIETIHAIVYFDAQHRDAMTQVGLKGFWMGYFASRAAPMGAVSPAVVEATFYNFNGDMVRRALPDAWTFPFPNPIGMPRP